VPFPDKSGSWSIRYYQQNAVENALEAIAAGRKRILLTLATGTGKTSIAFQISWKLFQTRWNLSGEPNRLPRILFLADRNIRLDIGHEKSAGVNRRPHQCFVKLNLTVSAGCEPTSGSYALGVLVNSLWSVPRVEHLGKSQYRREHRWPPKLKDIGQSARAKWS
jgi:hypothetical protein